MLNRKSELSWARGARVVRKGAAAYAASKAGSAYSR